MDDIVYIISQQATGLFKKRNSKKQVDKGVEEEDMRDQSEYPEIYRKTAHVKGSSDKTKDPFVVARILGFKTKSALGKKEQQQVVRKVEVAVFYRPEDTHLKKPAYDNMNLLFLSEDKGLVRFDQLDGRCYVRFAADKVDNNEIEAWCAGGPSHWYFRNTYDPPSNSLLDVDKANVAFVMDDS